MKFFQRLKKEIWRVIKTFIIFGLVISAVIAFVSYGKKVMRPSEMSLIIDSDTGNEIDDLFAVTLALIDPDIKLLGLTSAQWHAHPRAGDSSLYLSQKINEDLLRLHYLDTIPHPPGAPGPCGYWGDLKPIPSLAADLIISEVKKLGFKEKLNVVTLGSATNLATAIQLDTTIIPQIAWYSMGMRYDPKDRIWNKNEFNVRNDLDAYDYLLNREGLETHIMTATTSKTYTFDKRETFDLMQKRGPKWEYLLQRWNDIAPDNNTWIMWDVALIQAIMNPDLVTEKEVWGPSENIKKRIFVYTYLDEKKMKKEYRRLIRREMGDIAKDADSGEAKKGFLRR